MNTHHQRLSLWESSHKRSRSIYTTVALVIGVTLGSLGFGTGYANPWDGWDEDESNTAPMVESYQNLRQRSQDAFDELEEELGDRPRRDVRQEQSIKRVKRVKRAKRVEKTQRVRRSSSLKREASQRETQRPTPRRVPVGRRAPSRQPSASQFEARVLELVNDERARGGDCGGRSFKPSHPLKGQSQLARAAKRHALAMSEEHFFDHRGPRGDTPKSRIDDSGYRGRAWGENIAAGQRSPESVVRAWMKSPGHCRNILNPLFTELGVSFVFESRSPYKTYWVQAFGTPL